MEIIDYWLNQLLDSKPSPQLKTTLSKLIDELKRYNYPNIELVDIISIRIMIDYIVSSETLIKAHRPFIKRAVVLISDILGDGLYVKIEPRLIALEDEFRKNITISPKQIDDRLSEEVSQLIIERLNINENARLN